jgi:hypothetical protein
MVILLISPPANNSTSSSQVIQTSSLENKQYAILFRHNNHSRYSLPIPSLIHIDLFKTSPANFNISATSSYLDLAPLYGSNQADQDSVRAFVDGKLKPDCFSEDRVLGFPPGVSVLLVCFNRFHNYVVGELAEINEAGRFTIPSITDIEMTVRSNLNRPSSSEDAINAAIKEKYNDAVAKRDNDLFQTGRL